MSESGQPDSPDEPSRQPAIWRDRNFDRYWAGHALSAFGDQISALGLPLIAVVVLNAPAADVGLLTAAIWTPSLFSRFVGTWVDQYRHQQRLLIVANLFQGIAIAADPSGMPASA